VRSVTDLGPLKCRECSAKKLTLRTDNSGGGDSGGGDSGGGDAVSCPCGWQGRLGDVIRDYAKVTGQWFIGGAMAISVGFTQLQGDTRWMASAVGGTILLYAIGRVAWQAWALRSARAAR